MSESPAWTLRQAGPRDAASCAALYLAARAAAVPAIPPVVHRPEEVRRWWREVVLAAPVQPAGGHQTWLTEDADGTLLGVAVLGAEGELDQLYVHPQHTGTGVGAALIEQAKALHPGGLRLWTFASNTGAQRFYERHGFVVVARTDGRHNEEHAPDVRYAWSGRPAG